MEQINLNEKLNLKSLAEKLNEIISVLNDMPAARDRGPKSERKMTEEDATRLLLGDLKDTAHKAAAELLNLSYGQVYSARNGFTFKSVYDKMIENSKK